MVVDDSMRREVWSRLKARLAGWRADWEAEVSKIAVVDKLEKRRRGEQFTDAEVFEALVLALLSNNTGWDKVQELRGDLHGPFSDFDLGAYARLDDSQIEGVNAWFVERRAGAMNLKQGLQRLRSCAEKLDAHRRDRGSADSYFTGLGEQADTPERMAVELGSGMWKLPGFGVALSAEALRNLGFDVSKPDRHILRAVGTWGLVSFARWPDRSGRNAPAASPQELFSAMLAVKDMARANDESATWVDSTIWTACARGGAWLQNDELRLMTAGTEIAEG